MNRFLKLRPIFSHSAIVYIVSWYLSYLISQNLTVPSALLVISSLLVFELTQMRPYTGCSCLWPPMTRDFVPLCLESQTQTCPPSQPPPIFYSWFQWISYILTNWWDPKVETGCATQWISFFSDLCYQIFLRIP